MFGGPGQWVAVPAPFWGNYRQTFAVRTGAQIVTAPAYRGGRFKCLTRATVGSPPAATQVIVLQALKSESARAEVEEIRRRLAARYRVLKEALTALDPKLLRPLPFNAGCFALLELDPATGLRADDIRRHLLDHHDTGVIAIGESHLRIAFCSVRKSALPELVERLERSVSDLFAGGSDL